MASPARAGFTVGAPNFNFQLGSFPLNPFTCTPMQQPFQRPPAPFQQFPPPDITPNMFPNRPVFNPRGPPPNPNFMGRPPPPMIMGNYCLQGPGNPSLRPRFHAPGNQRFGQPWGNQNLQFSGSRPPFRKQRGGSQCGNKESPFAKKSNKKFKQKADKKKPWMTDELFAEVQKKNELYFKAKASNNTELWQEFRLQRNHVSSLIKDVKIKAGFIVQKPREDYSTEKPFYCDTCDRGFVTENDLASHQEDHIKCSIGNCCFEAHPKIVEMHRKVQHETGYAEIILKLNNNVEIEKWIQERRKRFPTAENIRKRKAEQAEKEERGEVMETKEFGKFKKQRLENTHTNNPGAHKPKTWNRKHNNRNRRSDFNASGLKQEINVSSDSDSDADSHITLPMFLGLSSLDVKSETPGSIGIDFSEIEDLSDSAKDNNLNHIIIKMNNSLNEAKTHTHEQHLFSENADCLDGFGAKEGNTVINQMKSADTSPRGKSIFNCSIRSVDSEEEPPVVEQIIKGASSEVFGESVEKRFDIVTLQDSDDEPPIVLKINKKLSDEVICIDNPSDECTKESLAQGSDVSVVKIKNSCSGLDHTENGHSNQKSSPRGESRPSQSSQKKEHGQNRRYGEKTHTLPPKSTLLEKLLANDIRHERNVILQCVRHIVKNNFFENEGCSFSK